MKNFELFKYVNEYWNGDPQSGPEYGYGDFVYRKLIKVCDIQAIDEAEAQKKARKICRERKIPCSFDKRKLPVVYLKELK